MINIKTINTISKNCNEATYDSSLNAIEISCTILFCLYLSSSLIYFIFGIAAISYLPTMLGFAATIIILANSVRKNEIPLFFYAGTLFLSILVSSLMVGRSGSRLYVPLIFIASSFGIAMLLIRGYVQSWGGYLVFYGLAGYFLIFILSGYDATSALTFTSHNGISITMLVACISLYIILSSTNRELDIKPALITLFISIWGVGRSGIASSLLLLSGLLFIRLKSKTKYAPVFYVTGVLIILLVSYVFFDTLFALAIKSPFFTKAAETAVARMTAEESPRMLMLENYFNNLDVFRLIFGVNVLEDPWPDGEINEYNYHNSFIHLHLQSGFMGLFTIVLLFFTIMRFHQKNKVFLVLLLTLILRSSTDFFIFFSRFDFLPFFFIFYFFSGKKLLPLKV